MHGSTWFLYADRWLAQGVLTAAFLKRRSSSHAGEEDLTHPLAPAGSLRRAQLRRKASIGVAWRRSPADPWRTRFHGSATRLEDDVPVFQPDGGELRFQTWVSPPRVVKAPQKTKAPTLGPRSEPQRPPVQEAFTSVDSSGMSHSGRSMSLVECPSGTAVDEQM